MAQFRFALALALLAALAPGPASAQINPFRGLGADRLTGDDVRMLTETGNRLLGRSPLPNGSSESWRNDSTGASGSVRVNNTFQRQGMVCHTLAYQARTRTGLAPRTNTLVWCRTRNGAWKIAS